MAWPKRRSLSGAILHVKGDGNESAAAEKGLRQEFHIDIPIFFPGGGTLWN